MRKLVLLLATLALVALPIAACGDDDEETVADEPTVAVDGGGAAQTIDVAAVPDGSFAFEEDSLQAKSGEATFEFENPAAVPHNFKVEDQDGNEIGGTDTITDSTTSVTLDLKPGEYTFYCDVAGHREGGMEGPLTVK